MKPPTVFLGEMTDPEVEAFLRDHQTVIVPAGSTEQHGPHAPLLTDVLIPQSRSPAASRRGSARSSRRRSTTRCPIPHVGFTGVVHSASRRSWRSSRTCAPRLATIGFRRIVFLNGHYDNTYAIAYACANAAERLPAGARAFPVNYWDGMTADEAAEFFDPSNGLHANRGETSAVLAINPALVDMERANAEFPPFPEVTSPARRAHGLLLLVAGLGHRATPLGHLGRRPRVERRVRRALPEVVAESTVRMLDDIERTFEAMPPR